MAIDKRIPRVLNPDGDNKTVDKASMLDALNVYSGPETSSYINGRLYDGGDGVLKNIRGNEAVPFKAGEEISGKTRLIGSVEDTKTDITYLFMYSTNPNYNGVWAYDRYGKLPESEPNSIRLIYRSAQFNFPANGFVKGDIVYTNASKVLFDEYPDIGVEFDKDALIYFTDGVNEPRKINAYRAFLAGGNQIHGEDIYAEADFITACPKTPLKPIKFFFEADESRSTTNFSTTEGFQFAYQYVYKDGIESAISSYSEVAFPPSVLFQGSQTHVDHNAYNKCVLKIPFTDSGYVTETSELFSIKILAKQGLNGKFLIIDEIKADEFGQFQIDISNQTITYNFFNDKISVGVSDDEVNKQFQSIPKRAQSQAVSANRLIYGNYTDGFDPVETQCTAYAIYKDAPEDFVSLNLSFNPTIEEIDEGGGNAYKGTSSGFSINFDGFSEEIDEGTEFLVNVTITPNKNWHVWRMRNVHSFQQSGQINIQEQTAVNNLFSGINNPSEDQVQINEETGVEYLEEKNTIFGGITGTNDTASNTVGPADQMWRTVDDTGNINFGDTPNVRYGTSAANPLILKGGTLFFYAKIKSTETITSNVSERLRDAFLAAFLNQEQDGFEVINVKSSSDYDLNAGLFSGKTIKQDRIKNQETITDPTARLISAVKVMDGAGPAGGYFIVNRANVSTSLRPGDNQNPLVARFRIKLESVSGVDGEEYPEVYTCIHDTSSSITEDQYQPWIAISKEDLESFYGAGGPGSISSWLESKSLPPTLEFHNVPAQFANATSIAINTVSKQIGYLVSPNLLDTDPYTIGSTEFLDQYCFMDGEGGPGGGPSNSFNNNSNPYDYNRLYYQGSVTVNPSIDGNEYLYDQTTFYTGKLSALTASSGAQTATSSNPHPTILPLLFKTSGTTGSNISEYKYLNPYPELDSSGDATSFIDPQGPNFSRVHSAAEISSAYFNTSAFDDSQMSFKTEANHDFGIIYYDQRGRHGFVNPLKSVFVEGYSDSERPEGGKGAVEIYIKLEHSPPEWAHSYKIAYSKNTSVSDFIQYSAGGAFVKNSDLDQEISSFSNIYVSLNYLQGNPVSYVSSFGARTPEGGLNLYKHQEGDKLRIISYFENTDREYRSYEFDVVDLVKLGDSDNPLVNDNEPVPDFKKGDFVVIKNNPNAFGFTYGEVLNGVSFWDNNCIFELRTPKKDVDAEQTIFYELPEVYRVVRDDNDVVHHEEPELYLKNGDVFFRPVAVNARKLEAGTYVDIIGDPSGDEPKAEPNFKNVYLESMTATDLFRGDNIGLGRPNIISNDSVETFREATVTYSDQTNPEGKKVNYSSFNSSLANFKDLSEKYGSIQYMSDHNEYLIVIQKEKISVVPVNKNVLSNADGSQQVVASTSVLNEAIVYPGLSGCDTDPSSVYDSGEVVYFANKTLSEVYRWTKQSGVETISDKGMVSMFRAVFRSAINSGKEIRVVGGYDPLKKEYLISILNVDARTTEDGTVSVIQLSGEPQEDFEDIEFMSAQQAIDYLKDLSNEEDSSLHPTFGQIRELLNLAQSLNGDPVKTFMADLGDNQFVDNDDFLIFLSRLGTEYQSTDSIFTPNPSSVATRQPSNLPQPTKMPSFKDTQQAINYLIDAGNLLAGEFSILRNYIRNEVALNLDGTGEVNINDFLALLSVFGQSSTYSETAFGPNYPGANISDPQISGLDAILYIIDQGTLTVGQYFELAQYVKVNLRANSNFSTASASDPDATVGDVTTTDVLVMLSVGLFGDAGDIEFGYDLNDTAFNDLLPE